MAGIEHSGRERLEPALLEMGLPCSPLRPTAPWVLLPGELLVVCSGSQQWETCKDLEWSQQQALNQASVKNDFKNVRSGVRAGCKYILWPHLISDV